MIYVIISVWLRAYALQSVSARVCAADLKSAKIYQFERMD